MSKPTYEELLERAAVYEHALIRIADKPREYNELVSYEGGRPKGLLPGDAYRKCGNIAWMALAHFSPNLQKSDLKRLDLKIRQENGWIEPPIATRKPRARKAVGKTRAPASKRRVKLNS